MEIDVEDYYRRFGPMVMRRCQKLLGNEARAHEAMQDTFVQLLVNQSRLNGAAPSSLLFRIATHVCLNLIRSEKRSPALAGLEGGDESFRKKLLEIATADPQDRFLARDFLTRVFSSQQESTAVMAVMFHLDEMTLEEIAEETGMSVSGIRKRLRAFGDKARRFKELTS